MQIETRIARGIFLPTALLVAMCSCATSAQSQPSSAKNGNLSGASNPILAETDSATQVQLLKLLKLSPTLTMVVVRDPSLLADQEYVARNSPELEQFLQAHPEVVRNPTFYLFSNLNQSRGRRDEALERKIWPDLEPRPYEQSAGDRMAQNIGPFFALVCFLGFSIWFIRILTENRRWGRIFRLQTEIHTKLIDRFGNNQELLMYMGTDAGRRFLEAAPIPVDFDQNQQRIPNAVARVLMPLQIGVVLTLLGVGLLFVRNSVSPDSATAMLVFGVIVLMPGLGFIIAAAITWFLAGRLGLMPGMGSSPHQDVSER